MSKPDAIDGLKRVISEELRGEFLLGPLGSFTPPQASGGLDVRIYNRSTTHTYIVRIIELVESVKFPDHTKES